jgi:hypothetical protein
VADEIAVMRDVARNPPKRVAAWKLYMGTEWPRLGPTYPAWLAANNLEPGIESRNSFAHQSWTSETDAYRKEYTANAAENYEAHLQQYKKMTEYSGDATHGLALSPMERLQ